MPQHKGRWCIRTRNQTRALRPTSYVATKRVAKTTQELRAVLLHDRYNPLEGRQTRFETTSQRKQWLSQGQRRGAGSGAPSSTTHGTYTHSCDTRQTGQLTHTCTATHPPHMRAHFTKCLSQPGTHRTSQHTHTTCACKGHQQHSA